MELLNTISRAARSASGIAAATLEESLDVMAKLLAPMAPHITAELWEERHPDQPSVHLSAWPVADPAMLVETTVTMVVQVNGKLKARLAVDPSITEGDAAALALAAPDVIDAMKGATPARVVARPPRLVNIVL
jgi:leucyl-tRNA synthetase